MTHLSPFFRCEDARGRLAARQDHRPRGACARPESAPLQCCSHWMQTITYMTACSGFTANATQYLTWLRHSCIDSVPGLGATRIAVDADERGEIIAGI